MDGQPLILGLLASRITTTFSHTNQSPCLRISIDFVTKTGIVTSELNSVLFSICNNRHQSGLAMREKCRHDCWAFCDTRHKQC
ncbi:hypothetical protein EJB05_05451, partial [Eragrostis curvula]